jgi:hypothetical protein
MSCKGPCHWKVSWSHKVQKVDVFLEEMLGRNQKAIAPENDTHLVGGAITSLEKYESIRRIIHHYPRYCGNLQYEKNVSNHQPESTRHDCAGVV